MKTLIIEIQNEMGAIMHELNRLQTITDEKKVFTNNEGKLKIIIKQRLCALIDACESMRELVTKLQTLDEYNLLHGLDLDELVDGDEDKE